MRRPPFPPGRCRTPRPCRRTRPTPFAPMADPRVEGFSELLSAEGVAKRVEVLAGQIAPRIDDETVAVCLLTGGLWFAADLMRALSDLGRHPLFDALWLSSYADGRRAAAPARRPPRAANRRGDRFRPVPGRGGAPRQGRRRVRGAVRRLRRQA